MARPSLKETRSEEILDAFIQCVARYGLDGSTTERIAETANVGRPLLRHYLGNRDEMVTRLLDHVTSRFTKMTDELVNSLPQKNRFETLMNRLFERKTNASENAAVFQALVAASDRHKEIRKPLISFITRFEKAITVEIMREKPKTDIETCRIAASGISAIYFNTDAIMPLKPTKTWRNYQKLAAQALFDGV